VARGGCGGLRNENGTARIINTTVDDNHAIHFSGGGICNLGGTMILTNSTVTRNSVAFERLAFGGGISNSPGGTVSLINTILALNTAPFQEQENQPHENGPNCRGTLVSLGNNLLDDITGCDITLLNSDLEDDAGLGDFTDNGTPGRGHSPLVENSPAVDAGNPAACPSTESARPTTNRQL
jgi:hypothetical protein